MKKIISLALITITCSAFAKPQICSYEYVKEGSTVSWTAFKTPKKVGVGAKFSDFTITAKSAKTVAEMLDGATFDINSQSVDSGDKGRDVKIQQFFFKKMLKGTKITGKVLKSTEDMADVEITMNGSKQVVPMNSKFDEKSGKLILNGEIDVLKFGMKSNLASITKACFEKHEGVTWPDVNIELSANVKTICK
jgi:polyisoprenoid-binding protein YceI